MCVLRVPTFTGESALSATTEIKNTKTKTRLFLDFSTFSSEGPGVAGRREKVKKKKGLGMWGRTVVVREKRKEKKGTLK